jgi:hypothetical protein
MNQFPFGHISDETVGLVMRETLRCIGSIIERQRLMGVWSRHLACLETQRFVLEHLRRNLPTVGVVMENEEGGRTTSVECKRDAHRGENLWFTVKVLEYRGQGRELLPHSVGSSIALMCNHSVVAAYAHDHFSHMTYGFCPGGFTITCTKPSGESYALETGRGILEAGCNVELCNQMLLLSHPLDELPGWVGGSLSDPASKRGLCRGHTLATGSVIASMVDLWRGTVGAAVLHARRDQAWDWVALCAISQRLRFRLYQIEDLTPEHRPVVRPFDLKARWAENLQDRLTLLMIHESRTDEFNLWMHRTFDTAVDYRRV